jgi:hypothetical protein
MISSPFFRGKFLASLLTPKLSKGAWSPFADHLNERADLTNPPLPAEKQIDLRSCPLFLAPGGLFALWCGKKGRFGDFS